MELGNSLAWSGELPHLPEAIGASLDEPLAASLTDSQKQRLGELIAMSIADEAIWRPRSELTKPRRQWRGKSGASRVSRLAAKAKGIASAVKELQVYLDKIHVPLSPSTKGALTEVLAVLAPDKLRALSLDQLVPADPQRSTWDARLLEFFESECGLAAGEAENRVARIAREYWMHKTASVEQYQGTKKDQKPERSKGSAAIRKRVSRLRKL